MNGQQPNHVAGMQGYTLTPQQQAAMMQHQQHQYSRMLNQQQQQQLPPQQSQQQQAMAAVPQQQQQQPQQGAYNQNFYQQGYIQNIQAAHGLLAGNNPHINNTQQQMMMPQNQQPSQQQQQQFYVAQQFQQQQQLPQSQIHQQQHHQQSQSQIQYTPQAAAIYQQQQQQQAATAVAQQRIISQQQPQIQAHAATVQPQRRQPQVPQQPEASSMHRNISQTSSTSSSLSRQSAFTQPISQSHIPNAAATSVVSQQQNYEQQLPQSQVRHNQNYSIYEQAAHAQAQLQQTQHHSYLPPQQHQQQIQAAAASGHRLAQQQQVPQKSHLKSQISQEVLQSQHQQHVILNPKPSKPSTAKEAENSALHNDMIRKQRAAEEKQKQMEREKRETQKIQDEFQTKQKQANQYAQSVQEKLDQFKYPILFAGCHLTTNLTKILPLPSEHVDPVDMPIYQADGCADLLRRDDPILIEYMSGLLLNSFEDVKEINVKHSEIEANIYDGSELPPLMKGIHNFNQYSFHVQTEFDDITLDPELAKAVDEVAADGGIGDLLQFVESEDNLPSTSSTSIMPTTIQQPHHQHHHHQVASASMAPPQPSIARTMSKPVNTTGKEPKGKEKAFANSRRKRDMAVSFFKPTFFFFAAFSI